MNRQIRVILLLLSLTLVACGGVIDPIVPTDAITPTETVTPRVSVTARATATNTATPVPPGQTPTGGPSPTSIVGPTRTPLPVAQTSTPRPNPNAPRIEVFTADIAYVYPGDSLSIFWSIRGADRAAIYRLDDAGQRNQLWNVEPSGSLVVQTSRRDRGTADFLLTVDNGQQYVEQMLSIPLLCAYEWFFAPEPENCAGGPAVESTHVEQIFEGGRMIYVAEEDQIYVLFADGQRPAWTSFPNRYVSGETPEEDSRFVPPPGRFQPTRILGVIWRASDQVRNRLALGLEPEKRYEGAMQSDGEARGETVFIRSGDGSVLKLEAGGDGWSIIAAP